MAFWKNLGGSAVFIGRVQTLGESCVLKDIFHSPAEWSFNQHNKTNNEHWTNEGQSQN